MIIDSHLHVDIEGFDEQVLLRYMDNHGIERGWLLSWEEHRAPVPEYRHLSPQKIMETCRHHPDRFLPFYAPDPKDPALEEKLQWFSESGFRGFGELKVPYHWDDPAVAEYLEKVQRIRPLLVIHIEKPAARFRFADHRVENRINFGSNGLAAYLLGRLSRSTGIMKSRRTDFPGYLMDLHLLGPVLKAFPEIRFVAHGPEFWRQFGQRPPVYAHHSKGPITGKGIIWELLDGHSNLYCDTSGFSAYYALSRDPAYTAEFINRYGDRVLFGTDNTGLPVQALLERTGWDQDTRAKVMGLNAIELTK